jgi:glycosyltransferase involved in cell wall biosynthesis
MTRILIDPEIFFAGRCGLVRYYSAVCQSLGEMGCAVDLPLVVSGSDFMDGKLQALSKLRDIWPPVIFRRLIDTLSKRWYFHKLRRGGYDAILVTSSSFEDDFLKHAGEGPFVMIVHDTMSSIYDPAGFLDMRGSSADRLAYLARRAAKIICVSENTKKDLLKLCPVNKDKIKVIYSGNLLDCPPVVPQVRLPEKYVLFVGERSGRKNFRFFAKAAAPVLKLRKDLRLVCTGRFDKWEADHLDGLAISGQCIDMAANDGALLYLYQHALCMVYPTLYEGFGLPVLEAMVNGCPVVTADCGSIREVGGDAVEYVDPFDASSIASKIEQIIDQADHRKHLAQLGLARAQLFSRQRMMQSLLDEISSLKIYHK